MMIYLIKLMDKPNTQDMRAKYLVEHKQYLKNNPNVKIHGALLDNAEKALGGAWVIHAESEAEVQAIIDKDPFYVNGLRASIEIARWDVSIGEMGDGIE